MKRLLCALATSALCAVSQTSFAAEVECLPSDGPLQVDESSGFAESGAMRFKGRIEPGDYEKVVRCWEQLTAVPAEELAFIAKLNKDEPGRYAPVPRRPRVFVISSPGGQQDAAFKIGKFIREKEMWVAVAGNGGLCYSACVYILAAGVVKQPHAGDVGVHRPYLTNAPGESVDKAIKRALTDVEEYFSAMNIPTGLAQVMFSIPPEAMHIMSEAELKQYRLDQPDIAHREKQDLWRAKELGVSRSELLRRMALYEKLSAKCNAIRDDETFIKCSSETMVDAGLLKQAE